MNNLIPSVLIVVSTITGQIWEYVPPSGLVEHKQFLPYSPGNYGAIGPLQKNKALPADCAITENGKTVGYRIC